MLKRLIQDHLGVLLPPRIVKQSQKVWYYYKTRWLFNNLKKNSKISNFIDSNLDSLIIIYI